MPVGVSLFVSWIPTTLGTRRDLSQAGPRPGERNNLLLCILQPPWIGLGHPGSASARVLKQHSCLTRARTPPSILPNSGEDERDSCLGLFPVRSVSERPPAECQRPPWLPLINGSWPLRLGCVLGEGTVHSGKLPRAHCGGGPRRALPDLDEPLTAAEPFPLLESRPVLSVIAFETPAEKQTANSTTTPCCGDDYSVRRLY